MTELSRLESTLAGVAGEYSGEHFEASTFRDGADPGCEAGLRARERDAMVRSASILEIGSREVTSDDDSGNSVVFVRHSDQQHVEFGSRNGTLENKLAPVGPRPGAHPTETARAGARARPAWLCNARFDSAFILGGFTLALLSGTAILIEPLLFWPILLLDLWVLGYHHVIATFTRLCFDRASFAERRGLIVHLLPLVAVATILVAWQVGLWVIVTIYFYWQWWHYARQSWGVSRAYRRADAEALYEDGWLDHAIFYAIPVYGILLRSSQDHAHFLGLELWTLPVPASVADIAGHVAAVLVLVWAARRLLAMARGRLATVHTLYMLTHIAIFTIAYVWLGDITFGYLMITIWHNSQYILFVWMQNRRRFDKGLDPQARFLSYISQPGRLWLYLLTCVAIAAAVYGGVLRAIDWLFFAGVSATLVLYQIVNFHHYIVDALIWKSRRPAPTRVPVHAS